MKKLIILNYSAIPDDSALVDLETVKNFHVQAETVIKHIIKYATPNRHIINLLPDADLLLCNVMAVENLLQVTLNTYQEIQEAAQRLLELGAKSVLIKASQLTKNFFCHDYWSNPKDSFWITTTRLAERSIVKKAIFSTAIAACLVRNYSLKDAIVIARMYVQHGLRKAYREKQTLKFFHGGWPEEQADLPYVASKPLLKLPQAFKPCKTSVYPIVDSSLWVEKLLRQGVKCIQLRIKKADKLHLGSEIKRSVLLAKHYQAKLFINDYWQLAIHYNATGVHLGQEDLHDADIDGIYQSGLYLGVSTHCYYEVARAHTLSPSYMACGPIYFTRSKPMAFQPQGIEQLKRWRRTLSYPLVAIGGINLERLSDVVESQVEGVSVISAITQANDPTAAIKEFLLQMSQRL